MIIIVIERKFLDNTRNGTKGGDTGLGCWDRPGSVTTLNMEWDIQGK